VSAPDTAGWLRQDDNTLTRDLHFKDFDDAMRFFERVAEAAVDYGGRRPDMCIEHNNLVHLEISNPHHAGLTAAELRLSEKVNQIVEENAQWIH
jgi:pterin-4a-carbinolamine dehydratase